ncbi:hypothetical protein LIER_18436 [Lithospermum erythrorhizon]|uniref:Reverse transcriptase n=1 Tax=Lithospermum erythrorhizon TaxID=34254 RepID=A0AAV3QDY3_LITER
MKDLGEAENILGMKIKRSRDHGKLWLSQERYILKVLQRFNMELSKCVSCPLSSHFEWSKDGCPKKQVDLDKMKNIMYASAVDMAGDLDSKRSTSGYPFTFVGKAISWQSKL